MGYEMYRLLTSKRVIQKPKKTKKEREKEAKSNIDNKNAGKSGEPVIDLVEEEKNTELMAGEQRVQNFRDNPKFYTCKS